jgi:hypothetical protein
VVVVVAVRVFMTKGNKGCEKERCEDVKKKREVEWSGGEGRLK